MFKMVLICNDLPPIKSTDGGTWRRLRVTEFTSKFVDNPKNKNEFKKDGLLKETIKEKEWKETFMSILIEQYKIYKEGGFKLHEPEEVTAFTKQYQKSNDIFLEFIDENIKEKTNSFISLENIYSIYKMWFKSSYSMEKCQPKKNLKEYLEKKYGKINNKKGWNGLEINIMNFDSDEEDSVL